MGFNYAKEKRSFDAEWIKLDEQYREAGFDAESIQMMRDFDWKLFCRRRTYENRVQSFPSEIIDDSDDGSNSNLFKKFLSLSVTFDERAFEGRYDWINTLTNPILSYKLAKLSDDDKELLTLLIIDVYTQTEIAVMQGCSQQYINKKLKRIKIFLE